MLMPEQIIEENQSRSNLLPSTSYKKASSRIENPAFFHKINLDDMLPCDIPPIEKEGLLYKPCGVRQFNGTAVMCPAQTVCECQPYLMWKIKQREEYRGDD
jgi:hypothetical protein